MARRVYDDQDDGITFIACRTAPTFTPVHDWVILSGISPQAICLYVVMRMRIEQGASLDWLAILAAMQVDERPQLDTWLAELADIDAVTVRLKDGHNVYTLHDMPPEGYAGRISLSLPYHPPLPRPAGPDPGPVVYYLVRADGAIKIGHSAQLRKRVTSLVTDHGPLDLVCTEPGGWQLEQHRHREFAAARISMSAEWFNPDDDLLRHIDALNGCVRVMA